MEGDTVYDEHIAILKSHLPSETFQIVLNAWKDRARAEIVKCNDLSKKVSYSEENWLMRGMLLREKFLQRLEKM